VVERRSLYPAMRDLLTGIAAAVIQGVRCTSNIILHPNSNSGAANTCFKESSRERLSK
jgi:hypothetical protein